MKYFKPLQGRTILDCSALLPGPLIGKLLALEGARVLKIENPHKPDGARAMGTFYQDLNSLKEVIEIDILSDSGRHEFHQLVRSADGLIEGFRPETKLKLGLTEQHLHSINPKLCIVSLVGYPEESSWRDRPGHDLNFGALSGCLSLFKEMPALPLADLFGAYEGALALTSALDATARGSSGSRRVVSLLEVLKKVQSSVVSDYQATGVEPLPGQTLFSGQFPCYRIYHSKDLRRISVGAIETKFWQKFCRILDLEDLIPLGFSTGEDGQRVIDRIQFRLESKPWSEWKPLFENADCCVEPVLQYHEVFSRGIQ